MSMEKLPLECLQLIITHLYHNNDTRSLSTLLRVNKSFCAATLPILYSNPFRRELFKVGPTFAGDPSGPVIKLINLLLLHAEPDTITKLLRAFYSLDNDAAVDHIKRVESPSSGINYLQFLQHFYSPEMNLSSGFLFRNSFLDHKVISTDYLDQLGLASAYTAQELDLEINPYQQKHVSLLQYLAIDLRVQLTWALCSPILENIQSLVIPLSDIHRYNAAIHRFASLTFVTFKLDKKLEYSPFYQIDLQENDPMRYAALQKERTGFLEAMIQFLQSHTRLFPNQLRYADCPDDLNWPSNPQICPEIYQARLLENLRPLYNPQVIGKDNWFQLLANLDTTNLNYVETIQLPRSDPDRWFSNLKIKQSALLERCCSLKELETVLLESNTFKWAVSDKHNWDLWKFRNRCKREMDLKAIESKALETYNKFTQPPRLSHRNRSKQLP